MSNFEFNFEEFRKDPTKAIRAQMDRTLPNKKPMVTSNSLYGDVPPFGVFSLAETMMGVPSINSKDTVLQYQDKLIGTLLGSSLADEKHDEKNGSALDFNIPSDIRNSANTLRATVKYGDKTADTGSVDPSDPSNGDKGDDPSKINVVAPNPSAQKAVDTALAQLGKDYVFGTRGPNTYDCSGLVSFAWGAAGYTVPPQTQIIYNTMPHIAEAEILPGDIVEYGTPSNVHHCGMFIGNGQMVEAPRTGLKVRISNYKRKDLIAVIRVPGTGSSTTNTKVK